MAARCRIRPINTINGCALEMQTLYRKARREEMDLSDVKSLIWILKNISSLIAEGDLEKRIEKLEANAIPSNRHR